MYNALGKLIKYLEDGEEKASYRYNGNGQRVEKTVDGVKTKYYWDGANIKNEGTANAVNVTNYFGANGVFARKSGSGMNTLYKNGHGDTVLLTNGSTVVRDYDYDAYGKEKGISSADLNPFRYSGEYFDSETGFIYLRNRYYDPGTGRFTSEDPHWNVKNMISGDEDRELSTDVFKVESEAKHQNIKEQSQTESTEGNIPYANAIIQSGNLYPYCMANPVKYQDPEGTFAAELAIATAPEWVPLVIAGTAAVATAVVAVAKRVNDPFARPGQKKQGRENKEKKKENNNWKPNPNKKPAPLKKHTPGRDHRKY